MTHVLIATPTAGGVVKALYATTLVKAVLAVKDAGWSVDLLTFDGSYVSIARNHFANVLLRQPHFTHLVMIDSDMSVEGHVICRLIRSDKPFVAQGSLTLYTIGHCKPAPDRLTSHCATVHSQHFRPD